MPLVHQRDGTKYRFSSLWFSPEAIQGAVDAIRTERAAAERQTAERQRRQAEDANIAALRAADEAATLSAQQASRQQYGATATAAAARISAEVNAFTDPASP